LASVDDDGLGSLVFDTKPLGDGVGNIPIFQHGNDARLHVCGAPHEGLERLQGAFAQSALRAMLENQNWIRLRSLDERVEIFLPSQLMNHDFRLAARGRSPKVENRRANLESLVEVSEVSYISATGT
jgi:hypothetical protein